MSLILKWLGGALGPYLMGAAGLALVLALGTAAVQGWRVKRLAADRDHWKAQAELSARAAKAWSDAKTQTEAARLDDQHAAAAAQTAAGLACDARVAEARRSSAAIRTLISKEPARDPPNPDGGGCPRRELVDADGLRDALRAPAP